MIEQEPGDPDRLRIRAERTIGASVDRLWRAWAEPKEIARWFVDRASGRIEDGETVTWHWDAFGSAQPFLVERSERTESRALIELSPPPDEASQRRLVVTIRPADPTDGGESAQVEVRESGFGDEAPREMLADVDSGWRIALELLAYSLEKAPGKDRRQWFAMRPCDFDQSRLSELYGSASGWREWLADEASLDTTTYSMKLTPVEGDGEFLDRASGRILIATARERALSWDELSGVLTLKAFAAGPQGRHVALAVSSWDPTMTALPVDPWIAAALDRLVDRLID